MRAATGVQQITMEGSAISPKDSSSTADRRSCMVGWPQRSECYELVPPGNHEPRSPLFGASMAVIFVQVDLFTRSGLPSKKILSFPYPACMGNGVTAPFWREPRLAFCSHITLGVARTSTRGVLILPLAHWGGEPPAGRDGRDQRTCRIDPQFVLLLWWWWWCCVCVVALALLPCCSVITHAVRLFVHSFYKVSCSLSKVSTESQGRWCHPFIQSTHFPSACVQV